MNIALSRLLARGTLLVPLAMFAVFGTPHQTQVGNDTYSQTDNVAIICFTTDKAIHLRIGNPDAKLRAALIFDTYKNFKESTKIEELRPDQIVPLDYKPGSNYMGYKQAMPPNMAVVVQPGSSPFVIVALNSTKNPELAVNQVKQACLTDPEVKMQRNHGMALITPIKAFAAAQNAFVFASSASATSNKVKTDTPKAQFSAADLKSWLNKAKAEAEKAEAAAVKANQAAQNAEMAAADSKAFSDKAEFAKDLAEALSAKAEAIVGKGGNEFLDKYKAILSRAEQAARNAEMAATESKANLKQMRELMERKPKQ